MAIDLGGEKVNINVPPPNAAAAADATDVIGAKSFIIMVIQSGREGREKEREIGYEQIEATVTEQKICYI